MYTHRINLKNINVIRLIYVQYKIHLSRKKLHLYVCTTFICARTYVCACVSICDHIWLQSLKNHTTCTLQNS